MLCVFFLQKHLCFPVSAIFLLQSFLFQKAIQRQLSVDLTMPEKISRKDSHHPQEDQAQNHAESPLDIRHPRSPLMVFYDLSSSIRLSEKARFSPSEMVKLKYRTVSSTSFGVTNMV